MLRRIVHRVRIRAALRGKLAAKQPHYLCSYPKSGRTWLRFILANYLSRRYELRLDVDFDNLFHLLPNLSTSLRRGLDAYRYRGDTRIPLILSSHRPYSDEEFVGGDFVFMVRNVCDVLVSSYFHTTKQRLEKRRFAGDLAAFVRDPAHGVAHYARYMNTWAPALRDRRSLIVAYEALAEAPQRVGREVLEFVGQQVDEPSLAYAVGLSAFERMQKREIDKGIGGQSYDRNDPDALRVRRGKIGGHAEYMNADDVAFVAQQLHVLLSPDAAEVLDSHGVLV